MPRRSRWIEKPHSSMQWRRRSKSHGLKTHLVLFYFCIYAGCVQYINYIAKLPQGYIAVKSISVLLVTSQSEGVKRG